jgi:predicted transcriptional regulator
MEKKEPQTTNLSSDQEEIMNRVNQTFDQWTEDVRNMIHNSSEESSDL